VRSVSAQSLPPPVAEKTDRPARKQTYRAGAETGGTSEPCPSITVIVKEIPTDKTKQITPVIQQGPYKHWWEKPNGPEWALFWLTIPYVLVSVGLFCATWRQGTLAKRALTELERPWVFASIKDPVGWNRFWTADEEEMSVAFEWSIQNCGRTPAFLIDGMYEIVIWPLPIPKSPVYNHPNQGATVPLAQGVPQVYHGQMTLTREQHRKLIKGETQIVFYGFAKYRDTLKREHLSRWIAIFVIPKMVLTGQLDNWWSLDAPPTYTEYT
jgi:hypothetical protein